MANKISINTVNDDQTDFLFDLMKGYSVSSFFKTSETKNLDNKTSKKSLEIEKSQLKAFDILLKCEKVQMR